MDTELAPSPQAVPQQRPASPLASFIESVTESLRETGFESDGAFSSGQLSLNQLSLGQLIRQIRRRTRLTQTDFARRYGIPVGTFRDWEQNRACPDATARSYLALIAKAPEKVAALFNR